MNNKLVQNKISYKKGIFVKKVNSTLLRIEKEKN